MEGRSPKLTIGADANIVNFRQSYLVKQTELWVVMDYMEAGALTDVIDNHTLEEDQIACICREVR